jgi:hypothetical protein
VVDHDLLLVGAVLDLRESKATVAIWLLLKLPDLLFLHFALESVLESVLETLLNFVMVGSGRGS